MRNEDTRRTQGQGTHMETEDIRGRGTQRDLTHMRIEERHGDWGYTRGRGTHTGNGNTFGDRGHTRELGTYTGTGYTHRESGNTHKEGGPYKRVLKTHGDWGHTRG